MKKISTMIVICIAISLSSFAQNSNEEQQQQSEQGRGYHNNNSGYNNGGYNNSGYNNGHGNGGYNKNDRYNNFRTEGELFRDMNLSRQQERRIARINDEYRDKISRIQNNRWGNAQQKRYQVERLEQQRRQEIMNILSRFQRDRYNAWCSRNNNNYGGGSYGGGRW